jgi:hypothetical protein
MVSLRETNGQNREMASANRPSAQERFGKVV